MIQAIESAEQQDLKAKELTADSFYSGHGNCEQKIKDVKLIAPAWGSTDVSKSSLSGFEISEKGQVLAKGRAQVKVYKKIRNIFGFDSQRSRQCPKLSNCLIKKVRNSAKLYITPLCLSSFF